MGLDLPEDDAQSTASRDDLARAGANDVEAAQRLRDLQLVTRPRNTRQRPRHLCKRDAKRVRRPVGRQRLSDGSLGRAAGERERG